jgi:hypothetical protein
VERSAAKNLGYELGALLPIVTFCSRPKSFAEPVLKRSEELRMTNAAVILRETLFIAILSETLPLVILSATQ